MITYSDLSEEQRQLYLQAMVAVARADGQLDEEETEFFLAVAAGAGVDQAAAEQILQGPPLNVLAVPALRNAVGALLLRDISAMAVTNNDLVAAEEDLILSFGQAMGFTSDEVEEFLDWAFMGLQWQMRSTTLLDKYA